MSQLVKEHGIGIEQRDYAGYSSAFWLSNGDLELVVPPQVGPRILRCGRPGGQNLFHNFAHAMGKSGEPAWQNRGGHRLWAAPETALSKSLDNAPIHIESADLSLTLRQDVEPESGLQKEIRITLPTHGASATLHHRITNCNRWPIRFAPWALSVMRPGGIAVAGLPPRFRHDERLLPTNPLVMWGYTDFSDPRWKLTRRFVLLRQDPQATGPQKTGLFAENAWAAYWAEGDLFVKRSTATAGADYPDLGCSVEIFTNAAMLELETLSPMQTVEPGASLEHVEHWSLHQTPSPNAASDDELAALFAPIVLQSPDR